MMINPMYTRGVSSLLALFVCFTAPLMVMVWQGCNYKTAMIICLDWLEDISKRYLGDELERRRRKRRQRWELLTGTKAGDGKKKKTKNKVPESDPDDEFSDFAHLELPEDLELEFPELVEEEPKSEEKEQQAAETIAAEPDLSAGDTGTSPNPYLSTTINTIDPNTNTNLNLKPNEISLADFRDYQQQLMVEEATKRNIHIFVAALIAVAVPVGAILFAFFFSDKLLQVEREKSRRKKRKKEQRIRKGLEGCRFELPKDPEEFEDSDTPKECPICMAEFRPGEEIIVPKHCPCGDWSSRESGGGEESAAAATTTPAPPGEEPKDGQQSNDDGGKNSTTAAADLVAAATAAATSKDSSNNKNDDVDPSGRPYPKNRTGKHRIGFKESCIYAWLTSKETNPKQHCPCCRQPFLPPADDDTDNDNNETQAPLDNPADERRRLEAEIRRIRAELAEIRRQQDVLADERAALDARDAALGGGVPGH